MSYYLSPNFTLEEMVKSQTAERKGIPNIPELHHIEAMEALCENILQPIRDEFGSFIVSSGFRSAELCLAIGSSINSQHAKGEAADFEVAGIDNADLAMWIRDNLPFDQLILECYTGGNSGWIHCSYSSHSENRGELLTFDRVNGYRKGLIL
jgi:zinc D-Ala-D-Ala carboxypeptidase